MPASSHAGLCTARIHRKTALFKAEKPLFEYAGMSEQLNWEPYLPGLDQVMTVGGNHFTLLDAENIDLLATYMGRGIRESVSTANRFFPAGGGTLCLCAQASGAAEYPGGLSGEGSQSLAGCRRVTSVLFLITRWTMCPVPWFSRGYGRCWIKLLQRRTRTTRIYYATFPTFISGSGSGSKSRCRLR